ncbi:hypothetical protein TREMEDRAFT_61740 [Tremella mesenterica DSM 1558]|uniref:uncharacterized protein n=1 Tax=Tremella mesenterica (strain ATCC 24925 / CBS 8224 / DSM 1558 / NBRC 9311 / NRRL Y-6157 / RJB 2259-6 / UBC 559-6) TaxID=578456 RepID=UPI0003F493D3|nr:uncharacterized protein TREMEDRAFT_61740 [Tremella mesenterica DSM 1558]EIW69975.1 hypothetical protein TREMEDRAFT_61740 [Tremella mesenterica DSM 1558]
MPSRKKPSLTNHGPEDLSLLSLAEVRARIERNSHVLGLSLFSPTSPTSPISIPSSRISHPTFTTPGRPLSVSPNRHDLINQNGLNDLNQHRVDGQDSVEERRMNEVDPVREKLLVARKTLLEREQELLLQIANEGVEKLDMNDAGPSRPKKSGQQIVLEEIRQKDKNLPEGGVLLPLDESFQLAQRDSDEATARRLASISLSSPTSVSAPSTSDSRSRATPNNPGPGIMLTPNSKHEPTPNTQRGGRLIDDYTRAQAQARMRTFMSHKPDDEDMFGYEEDLDAVGQSGRGERAYRAPGTGEEVDELGEDDEVWSEGNEDYLGG